jgi:uncharacterized protein
MMKLEWREEKRHTTLEERGLDFADAIKVFESVEIELVDDRRDYGEDRFISFGYVENRPVAVVWTPRGNIRRIISMRHAHDRELEARRRALD